MRVTVTALVLFLLCCVVAPCAAQSLRKIVISTPSPFGDLIDEVANHEAGSISFIDLSRQLTMPTTGRPFAKLHVFGGKVHSSASAAVAVFINLTAQVEVMCNYNRARGPRGGSNISEAESFFDSVEFVNTHIFAEYDGPAVIYSPACEGLDMTTSGMFLSFNNCTFINSTLTIVHFNATAGRLWEVWDNTMENDQLQSALIILWKTNFVVDGSTRSVYESAVRILNVHRGNASVITSVGSAPFSPLTFGLVHLRGEGCSIVLEQVNVQQTVQDTMDTSCGDVAGMLFSDLSVSSSGYIELLDNTVNMSRTFVGATTPTHTYGVYVGTVRGWLRGYVYTLTDEAFWNGEDFRHTTILISTKTLASYGGDLLPQRHMVTAIAAHRVVLFGSIFTLFSGTRVQLKSTIDSEAIGIVLQQFFVHKEMMMDEGTHVYADEANAIAECRSDAERDDTKCVLPRALISFMSEQDDDSEPRLEIFAGELSIRTNFMSTRGPGVWQHPIVAVAERLSLPSNSSVSWSLETIAAPPLSFHSPNVDVYILCNQFVPFERTSSIAASRIRLRPDQSVTVDTLMMNMNTATVQAVMEESAPLFTYISALPTLSGSLNLTLSVVVSRMVQPWNGSQSNVTLIIAENFNASTTTFTWDSPGSISCSPFAMRWINPLHVPWMIASIGAWDTSMTGQLQVQTLSETISVSASATPEVTDLPPPTATRSRSVHGFIQTRFYVAVRFPQMFPASMTAIREYMCVMLVESCSLKLMIDEEFSCLHSSRPDSLGTTGDAKRCWWQHGGVDTRIIDWFAAHLPYGFIMCVAVSKLPPYTPGDVTYVTGRWPWSPGGGDMFPLSARSVVDAMESRDTTSTYFAAMLQYALVTNLTLRHAAFIADPPQNSSCGLVCSSSVVLVNNNVVGGSFWNVSVAPPTSAPPQSPAPTLAPSQTKAITFPPSTPPAPSVAPASPTGAPSVPSREAAFIAEALREQSVVASISLLIAAGPVDDQWISQSDLREGVQLRINLNSTTSAGSEMFPTMLDVVDCESSFILDAFQRDMNAAGGVLRVSDISCRFAVDDGAPSPMFDGTLQRTTSAADAKYSTAMRIRFVPLQFTKPMLKRASVPVLWLRSTISALSEESSSCTSPLQAAIRRLAIDPVLQDGRRVIYIVPRELCDAQRPCGNLTFRIPSQPNSPLFLVPGAMLGGAQTEMIGLHIDADRSTSIRRSLSHIARLYVVVTVVFAAPVRAAVGGASEAAMMYALGMASPKCSCLIASPTDWISAALRFVDIEYTSREADVSTAMLQTTAFIFARATPTLSPRATLAPFESFAVTFLQVTVVLVLVVTVCSYAVGALFERASVWTLATPTSTGLPYLSRLASLLRNAPILLWHFSESLSICAAFFVGAINYELYVAATSAPREETDVKIPNDYSNVVIRSPSKAAWLIMIVLIVACGVGPLVILGRYWVRLQRRENGAKNTMMSANFLAFTEVKNVLAAHARGWASHVVTAVAGARDEERITSKVTNPFVRFICRANLLPLGVWITDSQSYGIVCVQSLDELLRAPFDFAAFATITQYTPAAARYAPFVCFCRAWVVGLVLGIAGREVRCGPSPRPDLVYSHDVGFDNTAFGQVSMTQHRFGNTSTCAARFIDAKNGDEVFDTAILSCSGRNIVVAVIAGASLLWVLLCRPYCSKVRWVWSVTQHALFLFVLLAFDHGTADLRDVIVSDTTTTPNSGPLIGLDAAIVIFLMLGALADFLFIFVAIFEFMATSSLVAIELALQHAACVASCELEEVAADKWQSPLLRADVQTREADDGHAPVELAIPNANPLLAVPTPPSFPSDREARNPPTTSV